MRIDTGQTAFDMQQIENRRFMYQPQTGTLILGYQYKGNHLASSHADEHFKSGAAEPFDSFIPVSYTHLDVYKRQGEKP